MSFIEVNLNLLSGFVVTLEIFFITLICAIPLGLVITFGSMSKFKPLKWLVKTFVWIIRGTPLMLQVMIIFYGPGLILGMSVSREWRMIAVLIAFVINYACYFSEIYRGGIESIPKGQYEAGQVLGMTNTQVFFKVVLMQVVKRIIPSMGNEIITLVKDTSLARVVSVIEIMKAAQDIVGVKGIIWPLFYIGAFYLIFNGILSVVFAKIENKLDYYKG